jgi:hypothetical protein
VNAPAKSLSQSQVPAEQRLLLETVSSNCRYDRGVLSPNCRKPFGLFVRGNKTRDGLLRLDIEPETLRSTVRQPRAHRLSLSAIKEFFCGNLGLQSPLGVLPRATKRYGRVDAELGTVKLALSFFRQHQKLRSPADII